VKNLLFALITKTAIGAFASGGAATSLVSHQPEEGGHDNQYSTWLTLISSINSQLKLFALIILVAEAMLAASLIVVPSEQRSQILAVMVTPLLLVIVAVTVIAVAAPHGKQHDELVGPLPPEDKQRLLSDNQQSVSFADKPPLSLNDQANQLQVLNAVIRQASRYTTPTYFLDAHLFVIHWNTAFEIIFRPILHKIRRQHVNTFIVELTNYAAVFGHARDFTEKKRRGELPLIDREPLVYESQDYGTVELEKLAAQLTDSAAEVKAWAVALLIRRIDWGLYLPALEQQLRNDKLWNIYAVCYDQVLLDFAPYRALIKEVLAGLPARPAVVLELGAGTGNVTRELLRQGHGVTAIENNTGMLEKFAEKGLQRDSRVTLVIESLDSTDFGDKTDFEAAVAVNVAYGLDDPYGCFRKVARALKPGGVFVLSTTHSETNLDRLLDAIGDSLRAQGTFESKEKYYRQVVEINRDIELSLARKFTREQYEAWLVDAGFEVVYKRDSYLGAVLVIHAVKRRA